MRPYCSYKRKKITFARVHAESKRPGKFCVLCNIISTRKIKSRIVIAKAAVNKKNYFYHQTGLQEETSQILFSEHSFVCMMLKL
jgi:hypothetical protein